MPKRIFHSLPLQLIEMMESQTKYFIWECKYVNILFLVTDLLNNYQQFTIKNHDQHPIN